MIIDQEESSKEYKKYAAIYGHNSPILAIRADDLLGIIVSVEETGICFIHTLEGRFFRKIVLSDHFEQGEFVTQIKIHEDSLILFLTNLNRIILKG